MKFIDLTGMKFDRWTVLYQVENDKSNLTCWMCRCDCGTVSKIRGKALKSGNSKGCAKHCAKARPLYEVFFRHVKKEECCWTWTGSLGKWGYGHFRVDSKTMLAHRVSWMLHNGEIPNGLFVCHHCDNPKCVNPEHLFLGTHQDNIDDMMSKGRYVSGVKGKNWKVNKNKELK